MDSTNVAFDIFSNTIGDLAAALIVAIFTFFIFILRKRIRRVAIMGFQIFSRERIFFYLNRARQARALGGIGKYIATAERELIYVGYWLASASSNMTDFERAIEQLVDRGGTFRAYLLNPENTAMVKLYAEYFDYSEPELKTIIERSVSRIAQIRKIVKYRNNIEIYYHNSLLQASCFIFDSTSKHGKILVDHKLHTASRAYSYGFELSNPDSEMYKIILRVYEKVISNAQRES